MSIFDRLLFERVRNHPTTWPLYEPGMDFKERILPRCTPKTHRLEMRVFCEFVIPPNQGGEFYRYARHRAADHIVRHIYQDLEKPMYKMLQAIRANDLKTVLEAYEQLQQAMSYRPEAL